MRIVERRALDEEVKYLRAGPNDKRVLLLGPENEVEIRSNEDKDDTLSFSSQFNGSGVGLGEDNY